MPVLDRHRPTSQAASLRRRLMAEAPRRPRLAVQLWREVLGHLRFTRASTSEAESARAVDVFAAALSPSWHVRLIAAPPRPRAQKSTAPFFCRSSTRGSPAEVHADPQPSAWAPCADPWQRVWRPGAAAKERVGGGEVGVVEVAPDGHVSAQNALALMRAPIDGQSLHTRLITLPGGQALAWPKVGYLGLSPHELEGAVCPITLVPYAQMHLPVAVRTGSTWQLFDLPPLLLHHEMARRARRAPHNPLNREPLVLPRDLRFVVCLLAPPRPRPASPTTGEASYARQISPVCVDGRGRAVPD